MLHVIGAGLPRTGTSSMKAALERLGVGPCYHMFEILTKPDHVDRWLPVLSGEPVDWDEVLDGYRSTQDWPASHFWREQAAAYPGAKVVLTVRDPHGWYLSMRQLIANGPGRDLPDDLPEPAATVFGSMRRLAPVMELIVASTFGEGYSFRTGMPEEEVAVAAFHRHVAAVKESLPADRLLVFDVREGWEPLCRFLDVAVPSGEPFPHLNDSEAIKKTMERLVQGGDITSPFGPGPA
ncbi:sulfotransferase family protein [Nonomuraea mangrovi]|uniref:Sulfotransferase family protein n=1 Tax=Nonomuraea mangrovi TaxID=2316207 RepID=A0ABW4SWS2_9ACTN